MIAALSASASATGPDPLQGVTEYEDRKLPGRVRGIALKGAHFSDLLGEFTQVLIVLAVLLVLSATHFRKKLG